MNEEKKYSVVGTVTIGSDEYRDLIEKMVTSEMAADDYRSKYWAEQSKVAAITKERDAISAECESYRKFLAEDDGTKAKYRLWKMDKEAQ